jgi:hypothetical protein
LLLELADMSGRQPKHYHRQQQADEENQHGLPAEPAHQIIAARSGFAPIGVLRFARMKLLGHDQQYQAMTLAIEGKSPYGPAKALARELTTAGALSIQSSSGIG